MRGFIALLALMILALPRSIANAAQPMGAGMMDGAHMMGGWMMAVFMLFGLLVLVALVLGIIAVVKYLRSGRHRER
jgi:uncharacterized membrane protein